MDTSIHTSIGDGGRLLTLCVAALTSLTLGLATPAESATATERGTAAADTLTGTPQADRLLGLGGNDTLSGRAAADRLRGGPGEDKLTGGPGKDTMRGEAGADVLLARDGTADALDCGSGADVAVVDTADEVAANCEDVEQPRKPAEVVTVPGPVVTVEKPAPEPEPQPQPDPGTSPVREELPLAEFPAGHGWTGAPAGKVDDTGPPHVVNNNRSLRMKATGGVSTIATSPQLTPVDFTHSHVSFQAEVGLSNNLESVKLRLASGDIATDYAEATLWENTEDPIILGSTFEFQSMPTGAFDLTGEVDWSAIDRAQIILTDTGLGLETILYVAGIYAVPTKERAEISFTFDDTYLSTYTRGMQKLSAYRFPATAYVIADVVDDPGRMTLDQLYELRNEHRWEIAGHSMTIAAHEHPNGLDDLEPEELKTEMNALRDWLDEQGFKRRTFAYPKGAADHAVRKYVARDYCAGRSTAEGPETIPTRDDFTMRGWSINSDNDSADSIKARIDQAVAQKSWLMLTWHDIVAGDAEESTEFDDDEFDEVVDYVRGLQLEGKVRVRTVADALEAHC